MEVVACLEAVALIAVVFLFLRHMRSTEQVWTEERRELLTRIQRPELVPVGDREPFVVPEFEQDEIALVGTIQEPEGEE